MSKDNFFCTGIALTFILFFNYNLAHVIPSTPIPENGTINTTQVQPHSNRSQIVSKSYSFLKKFTKALFLPPGVPFTGVAYLLLKFPLTAIRLTTHRAALKFAIEQLRHKFSVWSRDWRYFFADEFG